MSNRQEHKFSYLGGDVADAIDSRCEFLRDRILYYTEERDRVLKDLKKHTGVEWREHNVTGGAQWQPTLVYDSEKYNWLQTCQSKISGHQSTIDQLERVGRPYRHNAEHEFALDPDDVAYFHLGDTENVE